MTARAPLTLLESPHSGGLVHRSGVIHMGQIAMSCSRHSLLEISFDDSPIATLSLPLAGVAEVGTDGQRLKLEAGPMAAYLPSAAFTASTGTFEEVMICLDRRPSNVPCGWTAAHQRSRASC
ncbi:MULTISPECIES: hypothetical protein [unclassified Cyanobium]|uniref:hypothetical protein n=1 Tax=unclassified Cyanobium TaxID=2627006 RepID=UPI0020CC98DA|nr:MULTISPECIES: hypothetical protein [unclassified Cyanobium]MCP9857705.1 hypothetical protein [Cyanobium sp. Cruz-8H5]MCP9864722.1 hypothetical protein [Cyanobium sp. Cruz-8D1]